MAKEQQNDGQGWRASWRLAPGALDEERVARALFRSLGQITAMIPEAYDLNRRGQWRPYHEAGLVVDSLTQRTQLLELRGKTDGGQARVLVATGKHGEPPQMVAIWPGAPTRVPGVDRELLEALPLDLFALQWGEERPGVVIAAGARGERLARAQEASWERRGMKGWEWEKSVELPEQWWEAVFGSE